MNLLLVLNSRKNPPPVVDFSSNAGVIAPPVVDFSGNEDGGGGETPKDGDQFRRCWVCRKAFVSICKYILSSCKTAENSPRS